jgi:hypothetical protein
LDTGIDFPRVTHEPYPWKKSNVLGQGAYRTFSGRCSWDPYLLWRWARLLHAADAMLLDYRYPRITAWVQRQYPPGYVKECPPWAMR